MFPKILNFFFDNNEREQFRNSERSTTFRRLSDLHLYWHKNSENIGLLKSKPQYYILIKISQTVCLKNKPLFYYHLKSICSFCTDYDPL